MKQTCQVELFNGLRVWFGDRQVVRFRTRKAMLLLARLALEPQFHERAALIEWLWPDCALSVGRNRLSVTLSALRHDLDANDGGPSIFVATHDAISLNFGHVTTDIADFEMALHGFPDKEEQLRLRQAIDKFGGPILAGIDDDCFTRHISRLNQAYFHAVCRLCEIVGQEDPLVWSHLERAAQLDPTNEELARDSMRLLAKSQNIRAALRHYFTFEAALRSNNGGVPRASIRRLAHDLELQLNKQSFKHGSRAPDWSHTNNSFFGRGQELKMLMSVIGQARTSKVDFKRDQGIEFQGRLFTLTGGGGTGKTRLTLEIARRMSSLGECSVYFVPLAHINDGRRIPDVILDAMGSPRSAGISSLRLVIEMLQQKPAFMILDNFEHLIEVGAPLVREILRLTPQTVCLISSRRRLGIPDEYEIQLSPLAVPQEIDTLSETKEDLLQALARNHSVQLFLDRVRLVRPEFRLSKGNAQVVNQLCRALEGVPLSIELAAARAAMLSPSDMLDALQESLEFLRSRSGHESEFVPRHASVRATLEWSYQLLTPDLQRLLYQLAVFRGGWTLNSATQVCLTPRGAKPLWLLESLEQLREHSLIFAHHSADGDEEVRFFMLETVRQFAAQKQPLSVQQALHKRHAQYCLELAESVARRCHEPNFRDSLALFESEHDNLRSALLWFLKDDSPLALRMAGALWWYWFLGGYIDEGRDWLKNSLEKSKSIDLDAEDNTITAWKAEALCGAGFLAWRQGDIAASNQFSTESLELCRALNNQYGIIYSLIPLQLACLVSSDFEKGFVLSRECLALCQQLNEQYGLAFSLHLLGGLQELTGELDAALSSQEQSLALFRLIDSQEGQAYSLFNWGSAARRHGDFGNAIARCNESHQIFEMLSNREGAAHCNLQKALALQGLHHYQESSRLLESALNHFLKIGAKWGVILAWEGLAIAKFNMDRNDSSTATRLWSAAQKLREQLGAPVPPVDRNEFSAFEASLRASLPPAAFEVAWQTARTLTFDQVMFDIVLSPETTR